MIRVLVSDHALARYRERENPAAGRRAVARQVARHLFPALRGGLVPDAHGAVHVHLAGDLVAVLAPRLEGGWEVVTVYRPGETEDKGKGKKAG